MSGMSGENPGQIKNFDIIPDIPDSGKSLISPQKIGVHLTSAANLRAVLVRVEDQKGLSLYKYI